MNRYEKFSVGNAELIHMQDTWMALPPTDLFPTSTAKDWDAYREFVDAEGNITLNTGSWLVRSGGQTILVDTGFGDRPPVDFPTRAQPHLPDVMEAVGLRAEEVDIVLFTHLHFDHTGWNTVDEGGAITPRFRNARHIVQQKDWDYWRSSDAEREFANYDYSLAPLEAAGLLDLVDGEYVVNQEIVTVPTPGHTPGHVAFVLTSGGERVYLIGDAAHHPAQLSATDWCPDFDVNKDDARRSRHAILDRIEKEGAIMASAHFPFPSIGRAERSGGRRIFSPLS